MCPALHAAPASMPGTVKEAFQNVTATALCDVNKGNGLHFFACLEIFESYGRKVGR